MPHDQSGREGDLGGWSEVTKAKKKKKKRKPKKNAKGKLAGDGAAVGGSDEAIRAFQRKLMEKDEQEQAEQEAREADEAKAREAAALERRRRRKERGLRKTREHNARKAREARERREKMRSANQERRQIEDEKAEQSGSSSDSEEGDYVDANSAGLKTKAGGADWLSEPESSRWAEEGDGCCGGCFDGCCECCNECGDCLGTCCRPAIYYGLCGCMIVPLVRFVRRRWWLFFAVLVAAVSLVFVEMRGLDVSTARLTLNTGYSMPMLGLGTWQARDGVLKQAVRVAIDEGYRHFDTAAAYGNEEALGQVLQEQLSSGSDLTREDFFVTSKLWNTAHAVEDVEAACRASLERLQLDYLDLYLMHWPSSYASGDEILPLDPETGLVRHVDVDYTDTWTAMEGLVAKGLVRSIGLSNFNQSQLTDVLQVASIVPAVLQIESHPYLLQDGLIKQASNFGIVVTAYSPLGSPGRPAKWDADREHRPPNLMEHYGITFLAEQYALSRAQVLLRFQIQRGLSVVVKSATPVRIVGNADIFSWELKDEDMDRLRKLGNVGWRYCIPHVKDVNGHWVPRDQGNRYFPFAQELIDDRRKRKEDEAFLKENGGFRVF